MSVAIETLHDVLLSHAPEDEGIAAIVRNALRESDLNVISMSEINTKKSPIKEMRRTLAECNAVVVLLTRSTLGSSNLPFEVGFAMGWNKPVYVLFDGIAPEDIPQFLKDFSIHRVSDVAAVAQKIAHSKSPLSEEERELLVDVYQSVGIPTDQLLSKPLALHELTRAFNTRAKSAFSGGDLAQELMRLRKKGRLPRLNHSRN